MSSGKRIHLDIPGEILPCQIYIIKESYEIDIHVPISVLQALMHLECTHSLNISYQRVISDKCLKRY